MPRTIGSTNIMNWGRDYIYGQSMADGGSVLRSLLENVFKFCLLMVDVSGAKMTHFTLKLSLRDHSNTIQSTFYSRYSKTNLYFPSVVHYYKTKQNNSGKADKAFQCKWIWRFLQQEKQNTPLVWTYITTQSCSLC